MWGCGGPGKWSPFIRVPGGIDFEKLCQELGIPYTKVKLNWLVPIETGAIQPMEKPTGQIFSMRPKYSE